MSIYKNLYLRPTTKLCTKIVFPSSYHQYLSSYIHNHKFSKIIYITDDILYSRLNLFKSATIKNIFILNHGEKEKNLINFIKLLSYFYNHQVNTKSLIVTIGGGMVTDLCGFAASVYYRGIPIIYIPTTILSQVDAAIGGKNTINFGVSKNIIGTVYLPKLIIIDTNFIKTLPAREFSSGMTEIIKYGIGFDINIFIELETINNDFNKLKSLIYKSIAIKIKLVSQDLYQQGSKRKLLNLGHTLGQALEAENNFSLTHGEAVAVGLVFSSFISYCKKYITKSEYYRILFLLRKYKLPPKINFSSKQIIQKMEYDKKSKGKSIDFILLKKLGKSFICNLTFDDIKLYLDKFLPVYKSL